MAPPAADRSALGRALTAEFVGTAALLVAVVGSGIMAQRLSDDVGVQLLANAIATGAALTVLILAFGSVSGAHLNPAVSLADTVFGGLVPRVATAYVVVQVAGACCGVVLANLMFELDAVSISTQDRISWGVALAEVVATAGLIVVIFGTVRSGRVALVPFAVAAYITGAYWFTSSTSFANPAVTVARTLSDTFTGIAPASVPGFLGAQVVGLALAIVFVRYVYPDASEVAADVVQPHEEV